MPTTPTTKEPTNYYKLEERTYSSFEIEPPPTYVMKVLKLSPGITKTNFVCCIAYYMIMIFGFVATGVLQPLILIDPSYYNVDQDSVGTITSMVLVIQFIVKILVSIPYGHLTDRLGRKTIIFYGSANFLVSCLLVPLQTSVFPGLVLSKIVLANGISALRCVPLLADYFADESKGKATGISGMFIGVAAVLANIFLKIMFYNQVSLGACYAIIGIFVFVGVGLITLGLKGGHYYSLKPRQAEENIDTGNLKENIKEALTIFRGNGWLMIALVLTILGSSDFFVFFTFMTLYVRSLYPGDVDVAAANLRVNNLQTLVMIPAFFCNLFYGFYLDKPNKGYQMSLYALVGGAFSFIMIAASTVPHDWKLNLGSVLMGATIPGLFVIANYLGIKNFPQEKRGIMIGLAGIVGYFGFFLIASGGGFLYDHWRKDGPFLICAGLLVIALVLVVRIHRVMIEKK